MKNRELKVFTRVANVGRDLAIVTVSVTIVSHGVSKVTWLSQKFPSFTLSLVQSKLSAFFDDAQRCNRLGSISFHSDDFETKAFKMNTLLLAMFKFCTINQLLK